MATIEDIACGYCGTIISTTSFGELITQGTSIPLFEQRAFKNWTPWQRTHQRCPQCNRTNYLWWYLNNQDQGNGNQNQGNDFNK